MLTREKLIEILRKGKQYCACDLYTDENGLAFIADCSKRTVRAWRNLGEGPAAKRTVRWIYDLDAIVEWYNARRQTETETERRGLAPIGTDRKTKEGSGRS